MIFVIKDLCTRKYNLKDQLVSLDPNHIRIIAYNTNTTAREASEASCQIFNDPELTTERGEDFGHMSRQDFASGLGTFSV